MGNTDKFEAMASKYDSPKRVEVAIEAAEAIRSYLRDTMDKDAIDFGCGTGLVGLKLMKEFRSVLFLDSSPNMIAEVERKVATAEISNVSTLCFDMEQESLTGLSADYIFMSQVLLHIPDVGTLLSRLYEVLREGGHVIIVDFDYHEGIVSDQVHPGFRQPELAALMQEIGYTDIHSRNFYAGEALFMNQDATMFVLDARQ